MKKKVIHLIPQDGLGGVEQAARSLTPSSDLDIHIAFVSGSSLRKDSIFEEISGPKVSLNSPMFYINGLKYLIKEKPDLLVSSLWRSSIISIMYALYNKLVVKRELKLVLFLHATEFAHLPDRIITTILSYLADEIWCDSEASKANLFENQRSSFKNKARVISFFIENKKMLEVNNKKNNFVFWGRLAKAKRLDKAIKLFGKINTEQPNSLFYIYGPDGGELKNLQTLVKELELENHVLFMGKKEPGEYPEQAISSKFFINTSSHEGMAIAVTEAMQLGLVPIVTPVGEIANYCTDGLNSIYYQDSAYEKVLNAINDQTVYDSLSSNARTYWKQKVDYSMDFNQNCQRILSV